MNIEEIRNKVHFKLVWTNFSETLERVRNGSFLETKEALETIACVLTPPQNIGTYHHVPIYICKFLAESLHETVQRMDANRGFRLKREKGGRRCTLNHREELIIANIVYDLYRIQEIKPIAKVYEKTSDMLIAIAKYLDEYDKYLLKNKGKRPLRSNPYASMKNIVTILINGSKREDLEGTIKSYYYKHKATLQMMWDEASSESV